MVELFKTIRKGDKGEFVTLWQTFLRGEEFELLVDGDFGSGTKSATIEYQKRYSHLLMPNGQADGVVGPRTWGQAMIDGLDPFVQIKDENWPAPPDDLHPTTMSTRQQLFGEIKFVHHPINGSPENIKITNGWNRDNLGSIHIPQLNGVLGAPNKVFFHKKGIEQLKSLFNDWEKEGLHKLVLTWSGSWAPRFIRGSRTTLSNHAHATSFDVNYSWNMLGKRPALVGEKGSVRELVNIANQNGFYWGGHFKRKDGMHFEIAKLL